MELGVIVLLQVFQELETALELCRGLPGSREGKPAACNLHSSSSSSSGRGQELYESRGGRPGLPVPNKLCGFCGRKPRLKLKLLPFYLKSFGISDIRLILQLSRYQHNIVSGSYTKATTHRKRKRKKRKKVFLLLFVRMTKAYFFSFLLFFKIRYDRKLKSKNY